MVGRLRLSLAHPCAAFPAFPPIGSIPSRFGSSAAPFWRAAQVELQRWPTGRIVSYTGAEGARLRARLYRPRGKMTAVIVALHGMETHGRWFAPLALDLNAKGIGVLAMDRRGSGINAGAGGVGQMGRAEAMISDSATSPPRRARHRASAFPFT
jgi:hypothetical protein